MKFIYSAFLCAVLLSCNTSKPLFSENPLSLPIAPPVVAVSIDLMNVEDDKVRVTVNPPQIESKTINFSLPAIVPGTYSRDDYGNYIEEFRALDANGRDLKFTIVDENTYSILNANKLDKVTYLVNDTFDIESEHEIFSPSGTNISQYNHLLNMNGFVGYFNDLKMTPYEVLIKKPDSLFAATSLEELEIPTTPDSLTTSNANFYKVNRYAELVDSPVMYSDSKPVTFMVGETEIILSVFSPTGLYSSEDFKEVLSKMMDAQKKYLGDLKTTDKYAVLLYLSTVGEEDAQGFGALEHNTSTVVVMPEQYPKPLLDKAMVDIVAHEFFHVVTPLSIHSEEIHYFDFNTPKMSQHLWMYEGVTEYFAQHFQVYEGLVTKKEFYDVIADKMENAESYDNSFSFTEMSKNILQEPYATAYGNVYEKGALIGMCLDIIMREQSNGEKGLIDLMKTLTKRFGSTSPFDDEKFVEIVSALSYPEVGEFLYKHVENSNPINYIDYFYPVGLEFTETSVPSVLIADQNEQFITGNKEGQIIFANKKYNTMLNELGVEPGDLLVSMNGVSYNLSNVRELMNASSRLNLGSTLTMVVQRDGKELELQAPFSSPKIMSNRIIETSYPTPQQYDLRRAWLNVR